MAPDPINALKITSYTTRHTNNIKNTFQNIQKKRTSEIHTCQKEKSKRCTFYADVDGIIYNLYICVYCCIF